MKVTIKPSDICRVKLTKHGQEVYSDYCRRVNERFRERTGGFLLHPCSQPELEVNLYLLMRIFGKHLHSVGHRDSAKEAVFTDGIQFGY